MQKSKRKYLVILLFSTFVTADDINLNNFSTSLDYAQVKHVNMWQQSDSSWCFDTTVKHNDEGWDHYADGWQVTDLQGNELGNRVLTHPHNTEQPFTRRLCNVIIPKTVSKVVVRAKCNQHSYGGKAVVIDISQSEGTSFSVKRQP